MRVRVPKLPLLPLLLAGALLQPAGGEPFQPGPETDGKRDFPVVDEPLPPGAIVRMKTTGYFRPGRMLSIAFSPNGNTLASASGKGKLHLWEAGTGKEIIAIKGHEGNVSFSPDGKTMVSGGLDGKIRLFETATWTELHNYTFVGHGAVCSVAFSPDGKTFASGQDDTTVLIWDAKVPK